MTDAYTVALDAQAGEQRTRADADLIILDGVPVPVLASSFTDLGRFQGKVTFGDYSEDSDELMSSWILNDWRGGMGIADHIEGATESRFRSSLDLWTFSPRQLGLAPKTNSLFVGGSTNVRLWGEYDNRLWITNGRGLYTIDTSLSPPGAPVKVGDLPADPVAGKGCYYADKLRIPLTTGVQAVNVRTNFLYGVDTTVQPLALHQWDTRMFAITADGYLRYYNPTGTWDSPSEDRRLTITDDGTTKRALNTPLAMATFFTPQGDETVFVFTTHDMWVYDPKADKLYQSEVKRIPTPGFGKAAASWRSDAMYIAAGPGILSYSGARVISPVGPDRDDGVPLDVMYSPQVVDLVGGYNLLLALYDGGATPGVDTGKTVLLVWNQTGWHHFFVATVAAPDFHPQNLVVDQQERAWMSCRATGGNPPLFWIQLPTGMAGPKQSLLRQVGKFATAGRLYTGYFDAGMRAFDKLASHVEVNLADPENGQPLNGFAIVQYRVDDTKSWTTLGYASAYGRTVLPFGVDAGGFPRGIRFRKIEFQLALQTSDSTQTPLVESVIFKFIKLPQNGRSWQFSVPLDTELGDDTLGPREIADHLTQLTTSGVFTKMIHAGKTYRVRVAQAVGSEGTGDVPFKRMTISVIQVPIDGVAIPQDG